jgi:hypothetical protein
LAKLVDLVDIKLDPALVSSIKSAGISKFTNEFIRSLLPDIKIAMQRYMEDSLELALSTTDLKPRSGSGAKGSFDTMRRNVKVRGNSVSPDSIRGIVRGPIYMYSHEYGKTFGPRNSVYIAIPICFGLRPNGTPKLSRPRLWENLFPGRIFPYHSEKTGNLYMAIRYGSGKNSTMKLIYLLLTEENIHNGNVVMGERLGLRKAIVKKKSEFLQEAKRLLFIAQAKQKIFRGMKFGKYTRSDSLWKP